MAELWLVLGLILLVSIVACGVVLLRNRQRLPSEKKTLPAAEPKVEPSAGKVEGLPEKLSRTRLSLLGRVGNLLGRRASDTLLENEWEQLEEALLEGDVGLSTVNQLIQRVKSRLETAAVNGHSLRELMLEEGTALLVGLDHGLAGVKMSEKPLVINVVGVNGVGKTTTIGKIAEWFRRDGKTVLLGAADTFRAAAISQLKIWAERTGSQFVTGREGADPGAVAFDSVSAAKARGVDVVLLDTAGRLHTKANLMDELKKIARVVKKVIPEAPHETWLVVDGTFGQNSVQQAREFQKALNLTGVIVTKLDGTAKGGAVLGIASELRLPVKFIGVGESVTDLVPFEPKNFVDAILG